MDKNNKKSETDQSCCSPNSRKAAKEATQQAVLAAASKRFFSVGFEAASLSDIAKDAHVKVPLIVYHFKNKEDLWKACVNALFRKLDDALSKLFSSLQNLSGDDYIRALLTGYIKATASAPEYMRLLFLEGMQASGRLEWLVDTHQRHHSHMIMNVIEQAQASGSFNQNVDLMHAKYILATAVGAPFILAPEFKLITGENAHSDEVINRHVDACMRLFFNLKSTE
uniref:TetR/AcrR family transcriptional regulator n=1 Tax=Ningiella ruwaisensis TaxID=2364274 RepID=UPI0014470AED|nr:TetR/AcrR family transcriptional regulator [Ningiella ruwaisensis]